MFNFSPNLFFSQKVIPTRYLSTLGVSLMFIILNQLYSGIMCALYTVNDSLLVVFSRNETDMEELYSDDVFNLHERGVDLTFIFLYLHLFRKFYLKSYYFLQISAWKSGSLLFLLIHGIIFFGLVLCCTHLSDITLKIAANIMQTVFFKYGKLSYILFTNHTINTDTLIRMMYLHYILAIVMWGVIIIHLLDMHYGYRNNVFLKFLHQLFNWFGEIVKFEYTSTLIVISLFSLSIMYFLKPNEPLSYELFMWGDIGLVTDIRFLSVAPHWYFRAYMSWLLFCPHHYLGIFGLIAFLVVVYFHPNILDRINNYLKQLKKIFFSDKSYFNMVCYSLFILSCLYVGSYLPCGKYFTYVQGNKATTFAFIYIYFYWFTLFDIIIKHKFLSKFFYWLKINF